MVGFFFSPFLSIMHTCTSSTLLFLIKYYKNEYKTSTEKCFSCFCSRRRCCCFFWFTGSFHLFPYFSSQLNRIDCTCCKSAQQFHTVWLPLCNWTSAHSVHVSSLLWKTHTHTKKEPQHCVQITNTRNADVVWYFGVWFKCHTAWKLAKNYSVVHKVIFHFQV